MTANVPVRRWVVPGCDPSQLDQGKSRVEVVLATAYDAVVAERDALRRDAERYRWLRAQYRLMSPHMNSQHVWTPSTKAILRGESVDAAIDAAMADITPSLPDTKEHQP